MPRHLRIFVSSTMDDLRNERKAVRDRLGHFGFESVNAEDLSPDGQRSWTRVSDELTDCDVMVLILGPSYGWIPTTGPFAGSNRSVTELEFDEARKLGIPVLAFVLRLSTASNSRDAQRRRKFKRKIEDWESGVFRSEFDLAGDLADGVGRAMIDLLSTHWSRRQRSSPPRRPSKVVIAGSGSLPNELVQAVTTRVAVPIVGGGSSSAAGLPSVAAIVDAMLQRIERLDPTYTLPTAGSLFYALAADLEALEGPSGLQAVFYETVGHPAFSGTTETHKAILRMADLVVTTNVDELLERADPSRLVITSSQADQLPGASRAIVKLHGQLADPTSLVITETHLARPPKKHRRLITGLAKELRTRPLLALGSSMRDPRLLSVIEAARPVSGWVVSESFNLADRARLSRQGLIPVEGNLDAVVAALAP